MTTGRKDASGAGPGQTGWFAWTDGYSLKDIRAGVESLVHAEVGDAGALSHLRADVGAGLERLRSTNPRAHQAVLMDAEGYDPEQIARVLLLTASVAAGRNLVWESWQKLWEMMNGRCAH